MLPPAHGFPEAPVTRSGRGNVRGVTDAPRHRISWPRRPSPRWLAALLGIWIVVAGGAILLARALDSPVGAGARDEAQPLVEGPVAPLDSNPSETEPRSPDRALLALFPPDALPAEVAALPPGQQVARLRALVAAGAEAPVRVALGAVLQRQGDAAGAARAYQGALRVAPGDLSAQVGLAMVAGAEDPPGPARGAAQLAALAAAHPESQVVLFNQGLLALSRGRGVEAQEAWTRAVAAGPTSRLGVLAARALRALQNVPASP